MLQMAILDYYLIHYLGTSHLTWLAFDAVNITLLIISIHQARTAIHQSRKGSEISSIGSGSLGWASWLLMSISVAAKALVIFHYFSGQLDETASFFGPNTLKTTIALGSCTFVLLLITQHDTPAGSDGRKYIDQLTGTVTFDIMDTVDTLEVLFTSSGRGVLWNGLEEFILAVAVLNLISPTVPLFTLAKSKFGQKKPSKKFIHRHRIILVLLVNLPNLVIRFLLWHGLSRGVSPFTLKNILGILLVFYDIYEQNKAEIEQGEDKEAELQGITVQTTQESSRGYGSDFKVPHVTFNQNKSFAASDSGVESPPSDQNIFSISPPRG